MTLISKISYLINLHCHSQKVNRVHSKRFNLDYFLNGYTIYPAFWWNVTHTFAGFALMLLSARRMGVRTESTKASQLPALNGYEVYSKPTSHFKLSINEIKTCCFFIISSHRWENKTLHNIPSRIPNAW